MRNAGRNILLSDLSPCCAITHLFRRIVGIFNRGVPRRSCGIVNCTDNRWSSSHHYLRMTVPSCERFFEVKLLLQFPALHQLSFAEDKIVIFFSNPLRKKDFLVTRSFSRCCLSCTESVVTWCHWDHELTAQLIRESN